MGALTLLLLALLTVLTTGLLAVASREWRIAANGQGHTQALFNADAGIEEAKMRLNPSAPAGVKITPVANTAWRAYILSGKTLAEIPGLDPTYGKSAASGFTQSEPTTFYTYVNTVQGTGAIPWGWSRIQHKVNGAGQILYLSAVDGTETTAPSQTVGGPKEDKDDKDGKGKDGDDDKDGKGKGAKQGEPAGTTVNNLPILLVTTRGITGGAQREVRVELRPYVKTAPFPRAIHAISEVEMKGNAFTDSYNSAAGAYDVNGNRGSSGDVGTDSTAAKAIELKGHAVVNGNAYVGPNGDPATVIKLAGDAAITGTRSAEASAPTLPLPTIPSGVLNSGDLHIKGNGESDDGDHDDDGESDDGEDRSTRVDALALKAGVYWFSSIKIKGNAQLQALGPVTIYVTGKVKISGKGIATANNLPSNLLIYGTVDPTNPSKFAEKIEVKGKSAFYGAIYAPQATIKIKGHGGVFGALVARKVKVKGEGGVHYDEALQAAIPFTAVTSTNTTSYTSGYRTHLWTEAML